MFKKALSLVVLQGDFRGLLSGHTRGRWNFGDILLLCLMLWPPLVVAK